MKLSKPAQLRTTVSALCRQPGKIALLTHENPDGDGLAACLAFKHLLSLQGFKADIVLEDEPLSSLEFLKVSSQVKKYDKNMSYNIVFLLDCHEAERTGAAANLANDAAAVLAIDHHEMQKSQKNWFYCVKPEIVSAGAIIFEAYENEIKLLPADEKKYIADCIYTTILNDTDGFINNNTDSDVFLTAAKLCSLGTKPAEMMELFVLANSPSKLRFVGQALSSIELFSNNRILFINTNLEQLKLNNLDNSATSKITKWVKGAQGVQVIIYARQIEENSYRISTRSSVIDCNRLCGLFGGGGHKSAAGCRLNGSLSEIKTKILKETDKLLNV